MSAPLRELAVRYELWGEPGLLATARALDTLAALRCGARTAEGQALGRLADDVLGEQPVDAGVLGTVCRRVAVARLTELDDIHMESCTTPGAVVVPTAITLSSALGASSAACDRAIEIGYDAMVRLGLAIDGAHGVYRGVWTTYFCAPFAAAATAAALLELDRDRIAHALGLALTRATGLTSGVSGAPLGRWLSVGDAARAGCLAALAARRRFVADVDLHRVSAAGVEIDSSRLLTADLDAVGSVSVKPFPIAKQSLAATTAALGLADRTALDTVRAVDVHAPPAFTAMIGRAPDPASRLSRLSSAAWNVALALAHPSALDDVERAATDDDDRLRDLARRVEVKADAELGSYFPGRWPARVVVRIGGRQGRELELEELVIDATGDPPANDEDAVRSKWTRLGESLAGLDAPTPGALDAELPVR